MKDSFLKLHPSILISYFVVQALLSALCFHPLMIGISVLCAIGYTALCKGIKQAGMWLCAGALYMAGFGIVNPLVNHQGSTTLFMLFGREITLQSLCYGLLTGAMLWGMCLWLYLMGKTVGSRKAAYIFGKGTPTLTLMMFTTIRLIKRYQVRIREIFEAKQAMYFNKTKVSLCKDTAETLLTYALENGIDTADSMSARGYGAGRTTRCYTYRFTCKDVVAAFVLLSALVVVLWGIAAGCCKMYFFLNFFTERESGIVFLAYGIICSYPIGVYIWSEIKWMFLK